MKQEFYVKQGRLITVNEWKQGIADFRERAGQKQGSEQELRKSLLDSIKQRLPGTRFGIMFSGGLDSSLIALIARKEKKDFVCYTAGYKDKNTKKPEDMEYAERAAEQLGLRLKTRVFDTSSAHRLFQRTAGLLGKKLVNVVNLGVGSVELACAEMAEKDNINILFSGLGSEEIFAGYHRHKKAADKHEECWQGLMNMYERDLLRESAIALGKDMRFLTPFLDKELIITAMRIGAEHKIRGAVSKVILREAAEEIGLPRSIAWRGKRAAQYGSRLDKAIGRLAKKHGLEYKKDYVKSLE